MTHSKRKTSVKIDELLILQSKNIGIIGLLYEVNHDIQEFKCDETIRKFLKGVRVKLDDVAQLAKDENTIINKYDPLRLVDFRKAVVQRFKKFREQLTLFDERSKYNVRFISR